MNYQRDIKALRHGDQVARLFNAMFEDWMDESDRNELVSNVLSANGITLVDLDAQIQTGVDHGVPADEQISLVIELFVNQQQTTSPADQAKESK